MGSPPLPGSHKKGDKKMKVKVTKTMVKELNKTAKAMGVLYSFHYEEISPDAYRWNIDYNYFDAADYGDIDYAKGVVKAIRVTYPGEWYAMDKWITTRELCRLFCKGDSVGSFTIRVVDSYAI